MEENQQNNTQTEPLNQPCCSNCDKKSCWKWAFLAALLFLAVSFVYAGYQFSKNSQKQAVVYQPTPVVQPSPTPTPDPTANWKMYINTKYSYSFKYAEDYAKLSETEFIVRLLKGMGYVFEVKVTSNNLDLNQWLEEERQRGQFPESDWILNTTKFQNYPALYLKSNYVMQVPMDIYAVKFKENIFTIAFSKEDKEKTIIDQILSTFRFD